MQQPMSTSKAIGLVEQVIEEGQQIYRKDVLAALSMSLNALRASDSKDLQDWQRIIARDLFVKKGVWIDCSMSIKGVPTECCSECAEWSLGIGKKYCPNCGAKMDGENLYLCDPDKNTECTKEGCYINGGECYLTRDERFRNEWLTNMLSEEDK